MFKIRLIFVSCLAVLAGLSYGQTSAELQAKDPAWKMALQMVGGKWIGKLGDLQVIQEFHLEQDGKVLVGHGRVAVGTPNEMPIDSRFGWDPIAKQVYYVDHHSFDTVYAGHVKADGDMLVFDFRGLFGDPGHFLTKSRFSGADDFAFSMWQDKDGKLLDTHMNVTFHREKA